jgi:hypothetical protein
VPFRRGCHASAVGIHVAVHIIRTTVTCLLSGTTKNVRSNRVFALSVFIVNRPLKYGLLWHSSWDLKDSSWYQEFHFKRVRFNAIPLYQHAAECSTEHQ